MKKLLFLAVLLTLLCACNIFENDDDNGKLTIISNFKNYTKTSDDGTVIDVKDSLDWFVSNDTKNVDFKGVFKSDVFRLKPYEESPGSQGNQDIYTTPKILTAYPNAFSSSIKIDFNICEEADFIVAVIDKNANVRHYETLPNFPLGDRSFIVNLAYNINNTPVENGFYRIVYVIRDTKNVYYGWGDVLYQNED